MSKNGRDVISSVGIADGNCHLRAGTAKSDITTNEKCAKIKDPLYTKALALDDGKSGLSPNCVRSLKMTNDGLFVAEET